MGAGIGDFTLGHDDDEVGGEDGGEAVGDGDDSFTGGEFFQGGLDHTFAFGVQGGGGFVQEEDGGVLEQSAGDGEALLLSAGEFAAFVADDGLVAFGLGEDEVVGERLPGGFLDFRFGCIGSAEEDVVVDGVVEKEGVLRDDADVFPQGIMRDAAQIASVEEDGSVLRIVKTEDEGEHGALARTTGADQGDALAGGDT